MFVEIGVAVAGRMNAAYYWRELDNR